MNRVDLRSDTVTQPTDEMRAVMSTAQVGDDVFGEDSTVIELEERMASLLGKEAGLFVPSGTMSNAIAIRCHTQPGDEIITEEKSHIYVYEGGGYAALSGCSVALVSSDLGIMDVSDVESKIRKSAHGKSHYPNGTLVCMENTANRGGGTCYTQEQIDDIAQMAISKDCAVHMDGARLFNAIIASGLEPARVVRDCDTISICISKGLGAPVGGVLVGSKKVIEQAHRWRKMFGGGMRQAGILAAAGLYALDHHIERLAEDHFRARQLAEGLVGTTGIDLNINSVQTNMVYIKTEDLADNIVKLLAAELIDVLAIGTHLIRMVTHLHIDDEGIERTVNAFKKI
ncbi:beta-eliminating lyase-related protein [Opitutales bacterium]|nr:beta-eliminating lyase-related protein [Opitutales bacterium]